MCPFGYSLKGNGFDADRQRYKWYCEKACLQREDPVVCLDGVSYPPAECGYQNTEHRFGRILNLGERFDNGSIRLARDLPVGASTWKRLYHQARNASEARNSVFQRWGLKRLPVYGGLRGKAFAFLADTWMTLTTLARLVREATCAANSL